MFSKPRSEHIFILLPDLGGGGAERVCLDLAHEFSTVGYQVSFVLARRRGELLAEAEAAFDVIDLKAPRARNIPWALWRWFQQAQPDAILAAMWMLTVWVPLVRMFARARCRVVVVEHGILSAQYGSRGILHRLMLHITTMLGYRLADAAVGVSRGVAIDMAKLALIAPKLVHAIPNPVRQGKVASVGGQTETEALWGCPPGQRVLSVGRFKRVKNHALLLEAFARLGGDARLMLLGDGELEDTVRRQADDLGLGHRIIFAGFRPDPALFYESADLFVLSSDREGFGNVLVEAMAAGTPVVSTDCPSGPREILDGGRYGTLVPVGDAAALADAMDKALSQAHDTESLRVRARTFAPDVAARRYLDLLCPKGVV